MTTELSTLTPMAPAAILSFAADRETVGAGEAITFSWRAVGVNVYLCSGLQSHSPPPCGRVPSEGSVTLTVVSAERETSPLHFALMATNRAEPFAGSEGVVIRELDIPCPNCGPLTPTPLPTSTPWPEVYRDAWSTYTNESVGFAFDYPSFYDATSYCGLREEQPQAGQELWVQFGSECSLLVLPSGGLTLDEYVDAMVASWGFEQQHYVRRSELGDGHEPRGVVLDTVIMHHPVTYVVFEREGRVYQFFARHNLGCMAPEVGFVNPDVFMQVARSFRFTS